MRRGREGDQAVGVIYAMKGLAEWATCTRAARTVSLAQLKTCRDCPSATLGKLMGRLWLTCGPAGDEGGLLRTPPTCGCVLGVVSRKDTRSIEADPYPQNRRPLALAAMRPAGKTRCVATCTQGKW